MPSAGTSPGPHLERDQPAHRPDRPRPAQDRRHPGRPLQRGRPSCSTADWPGYPGVPVSEPAVSPADLQISTGDVPLPARGGQPRLPGIPRSGCPATRPHRAPRPRLASRLSQPRQPRLRTPLVSPAQAAAGPHPLAPLKRPPGSPRSMTTADEEVTPCNRRTLIMSHAEL